MLFFNIDHIERELSPQSKAASSGFFFASASMSLFLAHLENENLAEAASSARDAASRFEISADQFRALAGTIRGKFPWVCDAVRDVSFDEAARAVDLDATLPIVSRITQRLVRGELDQVLRSCADELSEMATRLRNTAGRISQSYVSLDFEFETAHGLISYWRASVARGQYVSSVCLRSVSQTASI